MNFDRDLFEKYNVTGPRYTSYPTVPYWETTPSEMEWVSLIGNEIKKAESEKLGAAIYVHIPFCETLCTYCGCNTRITRNHGVESPYVDTILKEWALYRDRLGISEQNPLALSELHFGGGTPTFLKTSELERLVDGLLKYCKVKEGSSFSIEVDPRVTKEDQLKSLAARGFNRLSLGVQDFDPKVQDIVHRVQSEEQVRAVTEAGRTLGFKSICYDLIYGLPLQTQESVRTTLETVKRLKPDRIAFYAYAHVPWIRPGQRRFTEDDLPEGENKRALYELGRTSLEAAGFSEVGMDHFAVKSDELWKAYEQKTLHRSFMGYTSRRVTPLIGLGVSAIGDSWTGFLQNEKLLEKYQERVSAGEIPILRGHVLNKEDLVLRKHVLNIMTQFETSWKNPELQTDFLKDIDVRLAEFEKDGLIEKTAQGLKVTKKGHPFLRNICMVFDARLFRKAPSTELFSRTI